MPAPNNDVLFERAMHLMEDGRNLSYALHREVQFWDEQTRTSEWCNVAERVDPAMCKRYCPGFLIEHVTTLAKREHRKPTVLDCGSGPYTTLYYLQLSGLAEVTACDILGAAFEDLHRRHGLRGLVAPRTCPAEFLDELPGFGEFDVVWIANALDHTSAPTLSWLNLFQAARVGGIIGHVHFVKEATKEGGDQLHQFDLYPDDGDLCLQDFHGGQPVKLTHHLPLENISMNLGDYRGIETFDQIWRKTGNVIDSAEFLAAIVEDLRRVFRRRSNWAFELEHLVNTMAAAGSPEPTYDLAKLTM